MNWGQMGFTRTLAVILKAYLCQLYFPRAPHQINYKQAGWIFCEGRSVSVWKVWPASYSGWEGWVWESVIHPKDQNQAHS